MEDGQQVKKAVNEIKAFYDCRYLSACETTWRIFTRYRTPSVEQLSFHLMVIYLKLLQMSSTKKYYKVYERLSRGVCGMDIRCSIG
nr:ATP-dependent DNA helicase PIF1 [Tanacetum cinerariifolium]